MPLLIVTTPDGDRRVVRLQVGKKRLIGSHPRCSVRLAPDVAEPFHCEVFHAFGLWHVRDLGTITGTRLNGRPVTEDSLAGGDAIEIGEARLSFQVEAKRLGATPRRSPAAARSPRDLPHRRIAAARARRARASGAPVLAVSLGLVGLLVVGVVLMGRGPDPGDFDEVASARGPSSDPDARETASRPLPPATPESAPVTPPSPSGVEVDPAGVGEDVVEPSESPEPVEVAAAPASSAVERLPALPESAPPERPTEEATERSTEGATAERSARRDAARWGDDMLRALAALDFSSVETLLESGRAQGVAEETRSAIEEECREVRRAWEELHAALEAAATKKALYEVPQEVSLASYAPSAALTVSLRPERGLRLNAVEGNVAEVADGLERPLGAVRATSLPDEILVRLLVGDRRPSPDEERGARRRLSRLLRHVEGEERARLCLGEEGSLQEPPTDPGLSGAEPGRWLRLRVEILALRRARLEQAGEKEPRAWARLAGEALSLLLAAPSSSGNEEQLQRLRRDFLRARASSLPLEALFRASRVETLPDGRVRLVFDFQGEKTALQQAADLHAVGFHTEAPRYVRGRLVLQGEYRLLEGEPFVDRLSIDGKAVPMTPDSPNVNVALWTQSTDAVTCLDGEAASWFSLLRENPGRPSDYFVFGMGYRTVTWRLVDQPAEQVVLAGSRETVALPAHVLLAGVHGASLHKDLGECLFAEPAPPARSRRIDFHVELDSERATWSVNGRPLELDGEEVRTRLGARSSRKGSASILTNGRPVALETLEVVGRLDETWVAARIEARATADLARAVPGPAAP